MTFRYAICNETFQGWDHERICRFVAACGYQGLEIAPFTWAPRITDVSPEQRLTYRKQAEDAGLKLIGLHWLLAKTEGLCITDPDPAIRRRTAEYLGELARCCRDIGGDLLILGSPAQRKIPAGYSRSQAADFALDTLRQTAGALSDFGVTLCLEPLAPSETDFLNTCDEARELLERLAHPNFALHLDVKAMSSEAVPVPDLIRRFARWTRHFHANDANRRGPGFGSVDFRPIFAALQDADYRGWVSVEVFDYSPDPETIARDSISYMRLCEPK
ncbi:MAG: sugar phosphate isomerase/epimerase [Gemmataceae bacterium]|nr:sugar phosphate isomerase/epimerase [Gemmataceae bacterium]